MNSTNADYIFKFITLGDSSVGKSCLSYQYTDQTFTGHHEPTIGPGFGHQIVTVKRKKLKLYIWDTAGQERFRSITKFYYRDTTAVLLVYDITNRETFDNVSSWLEDLRENTTLFPTVMLVGNKADMDHQRAVSTDEGAQFAKEHGLMFVECSAKTGQNVEDAFMKTAEAAYESIRQIEADKVEVLRLRGVRVIGSNGGFSTIYNTVTDFSDTVVSSCCRIS